MEEEPISQAACPPRMQTGRQDLFHYQFLSSNYESYIEVNLEKEPDMRRIFENDLMDDSAVDRS